MVRKRIQSQLRLNNDIAAVAADQEEAFTANPAEDPPTPWAKSRAKKLCQELIMNKSSYVQGMPASHVYWTDAIFMCYDKAKFANNYNRLKTTIEEEELIAGFEQFAFNVQKPLLYRNTLNSRGQPFWDTHAAKPLLQTELKSGIHNGKELTAIRNSNDLYKEFDLPTFSNHFYREKRRLKEDVFWQAKRNRKGRQQREKEEELHYDI
jgi:hypothetical protein